MSLWEILVPAEIGVVHNTIANPSFEYNNVSTYSQIDSFQNHANNGIKYWKPINNASVSRSNNWASQGAYSLKIAAGTTNGAGVSYNPRSSIIDISNGITYTLSSLAGGSLSTSQHYTFAIMGLDDIGMSLASGISDIQSMHVTLNSPNSMWAANASIDGKRGHTNIIFTSSYQPTNNAIRITITDSIKSIEYSPKGYAIWVCVTNSSNPTGNGTYTLLSIVPNAYFSQYYTIPYTDTLITVKQVIDSLPMTLVSNATVTQNQYISNRLYVSSESRNGTITWNSGNTTVTASNSVFSAADVGRTIYSIDVTAGIGWNITTSGASVTAPSGFFNSSDVGRTLFTSAKEFIGIIGKVNSINSVDLLDTAAVTVSNQPAYWGSKVGVISSYTSTTSVSLTSNPPTTESVGKSFSICNNVNLKQNYSVYCLRNNQYLFLGKIKQFLTETAEIEFYENTLSAHNIVNEPIYVTSETNPASFPNNQVGGLSSFTVNNGTYTPNYINLNCTAPYWGVTNENFGGFTKKHHLYLDWCLDNNSNNPNVSYNDTGALWSVYLHNNSTNQSTLLGTLDASNVTSQASKRIGLRKKFLVSRPSGNTSDMSVRIIYTGTTSDANLYIDSVQFVDVGMIWRAYDFYGGNSSTYSTPMHFDDWDWDSIEFSYVDGDVPGAAWTDMMPVQSGTYQASFPYFDNTGVWHSDAYEYGVIENANGYASPRFRKQIQWKNENKPIYGVSIPGLSQSVLLTQSTSVGFWAEMTNDNINVVVEPNTTGVGMPDIKTTSLEYGIVDGGFVQRQISQMRQMQFTLTISAQSWKGLHANRRSLINLLKFDQLAQQGDRMLRYTGADTPIVTSVTYLDGLGYNGTSQNASFTEYVQLRFLSSDPYFYAQTKITQKLTNENINANDKSIIHYKIGNDSEWLPLNKHYVENSTVYGESYFYNEDKTQTNTVNDMGWIYSPSGNTSALVVGGSFEYPFSKIAFFFLSGISQKNTSTLPQNTSGMFSGEITTTTSSRIVTSNTSGDFNNVTQGSYIVSAGGIYTIGTVQSFTKTNYTSSVSFNNGATSISGTFTGITQDILNAGAIWINTNGVYTFIGAVTSVTNNAINFSPAWSGATQTNVTIAYGGGYTNTQIVLTANASVAVTNQYNCKFITSVNNNVVDISGNVFGKQGFTLNGEIKRLYQDSPNSVIAVGSFSQVIESVETTNGSVVAVNQKNNSSFGSVYLNTRMVRFQLSDTGRIIAESVDYIKPSVFTSLQSNLFSLLRYQETVGTQSYSNAAINDVINADGNAYLLATQSNILSNETYDRFFPYRLTRNSQSFAPESMNSPVVYLDAEKNPYYVGIRLTGLASGTISSNSGNTNLLMITGSGTNFNEFWTGKSLFTNEGLYIGQVYFVENNEKLFLSEAPTFAFSNIKFEVTVDAKSILVDKNYKKNIIYAILNDSSITNEQNLWNTYVWAYIKNPKSISAISAIKGSRSLVGSGFHYALGTENKGTIAVAQNDVTVTGSGTEFNDGLIGNYIIAFDNTNYTIRVGQVLSVTSVNELILTENSPVTVTANTKYIVRPFKFFTDNDGLQSLGGIILSNTQSIATTNFNSQVTKGAYTLNDFFNTKTTNINNVIYSIFSTLQQRAYNPFYFVDKFNTNFYAMSEINFTGGLIRSFVGKNYHSFFNPLYADSNSFARNFPEIPANKAYTSIVDGAIDTSLYQGAGTISSTTANFTSGITGTSTAFSLMDVGRSIYNENKEFIGVITKVNSVNGANAITFTQSQSSSSGGNYYLSGVSWYLGTGTLESFNSTTVVIYFSFATATTTDIGSLIGARLKRVTTGESLGIIIGIQSTDNGASSTSSQKITYTVTRSYGDTAGSSSSPLNEPYAISVPIYMYQFALNGTPNAPTTPYYSNQNLGMQTAQQYSGSYSSIAIQAYNNATSEFFAPNFQHFPQGAGLITTSTTSRLVAGLYTNFSTKDIGKNLYSTSGEFIGRIASITQHPATTPAATTTYAVLAENATLAVTTATYLIGLPYALYAYINYMWFFIGEVQRIQNSTITLVSNATETMPEATALSLIPYMAIETSATNYGESTSTYFPYKVNDEIYAEFSGKTELPPTAPLYQNVVQNGNYLGTIGNVRNLFFTTISNANSTASATASLNDNKLTSVTANTYFSTGDVIFSPAGLFVGVVREQTSAQTTVNLTATVANATTGNFLRLASPGKTTVSIFPNLNANQLGDTLPSTMQLSYSTYESKSKINSLIYTIAKTITGSTNNNYFADGVGYATGFTQYGSFTTNYSLESQLSNDRNDLSNKITLPNVHITGTTSSSVLTISNNSIFYYSPSTVSAVTVGASWITITGASTTPDPFLILNTSTEPLIGRPVYNATWQYVGTIRQITQTNQYAAALMLESPALNAVAANATIYIHKTPVKYAIFPNDVIRDFTNQIIGVVKSVNLITRQITLYQNATKTISTASPIHIQRGYGFGEGIGKVTTISLGSSFISGTCNTSSISFSTTTSTINSIVGSPTITSSTSSDIVSSSLTNTFTNSDVGRNLYDTNNNLIGTIAKVISGQDVQLTSNAIATITSSSCKISICEIGRSLFTSTGIYIGTIINFGSNNFVLEENAKINLSTTTAVYAEITLSGPSTTASNCPFFSQVPITNNQSVYPSENLTAIYVNINSSLILLGYANQNSFATDSQLKLYRAKSNVYVFPQNNIGYSWGFKNEYNQQYLYSGNPYQLSPDDNFELFSTKTTEIGSGLISTSTNSTTVTITQGTFKKSDVGIRIFSDASALNYIGTVSVFVSANQVTLSSNATETILNQPFYFTQYDHSCTLPFIPGLGTISFMGDASGVSNRSLSIKMNDVYSRNVMKQTSWFPTTVRVSSFFSGYTFTLHSSNISFTSGSTSISGSNFTNSDVGSLLYTYDNTANVACFRLMGIIASVTALTTAVLVSNAPSTQSRPTYKAQLAGLTNAGVAAGGLIVNSNNPARTIIDTGKKMYRADNYAFIGTLTRDSRIVYQNNNMVNATDRRPFFLASEPTQFLSQIIPGNMLVITSNVYNTTTKNDILYAGIVTNVIDNVTLDMKLIYANSSINTQEYGFMNQNYSYYIVPMPAEGFAVTPGEVGYVQNDWQPLGRQNGKVNTINGLNNGDILVGGEFTAWADKTATYNNVTNTVSSSRNVYGIAKVVATTTNDGKVIDAFGTPVVGTSYTANGVQGNVQTITDVSDVNPINGYVGSADKVLIGGYFSQTMNNEILLPSVASIEGSTLANSMRPAISIDFENSNPQNKTYASVKRIAASNRLRQYYQNPNTNILDGINGSNIAMLFDNSIAPNTKMQYTTIRVRGNASVYPVITIKNPTNQNKQLIGLHQTETGAKIMFNNSLLTIFPNETIIIDFRIGKRSITSTVRGNIISYVHPLSNFVDWILIGSNNAAGMNTQSTDDYRNNVIGLHADSGIEVNLSYTPRFWSFDANNMFFGTYKAGL